MELFLQQVLNGIMMGSTYAMVALGLTLMYGILVVPQIAHGHVYMLGAYVAFTLIVFLNVNFWVALVISMVLLAGLGVVLERLVFRNLKYEVKGSRIFPYIGALGLFFLLEHLANVIWGSAARRIPNPNPEMVEFLGVAISLQRLLVIIIAALAIILLHLFIKKTIIGTAIDAAAQEPEGASLVGINVNMTASLTFAIAGALAAVAAIMIGPIFMVDPQMGAIIIMKCMVVVILGGLGSIKGAIIAAYILGLIEALGGGYISTAYRDVFAFGILILILTIKPTGLFGREV